MTKVVELFSTFAEHEGTPEEVVNKLVAMGWEVAEQKPEAITLRHELITGASRIVLLES